MYTQTKAYTAPLTRKLAAEVATMPKWKGEREQSDARLAYLSREVEAGRFYSPTWAFAHLGGKKYRVNGQHSSTVLANANGHFPAGLKVNIHEFECDDENDLATLFGTYDSIQSGRNLKDIVRSHAATVPELDGISTQFVQQMIAGVSLALQITGLSSTRIPRDERARLARPHADFIRWQNDTFGFSVLYRKPVIAAMYVTRLKSTGDADSFWKLVADGSHANHSHPSRRLRDFLLAYRGTNRARNSEMSDREIYVKSISAWNNFRTKKLDPLRGGVKQILNAL